MYRPQFAYPTPEGFQDEDFVHYFDQSNTTQLNAALALAAGATIENIALQLQTDAPFSWRGLKINGPANFAIRFRDPYGNFLSNDYLPLPLEYSPQETSVRGSNVVPFGDEIKCPAGSVIRVDIKRLS